MAVRSSLNALTVTFTTDHSVELAGFLIEWSSVVATIRPGSGAFAFNWHCLPDWLGKCTGETLTHTTSRLLLFNHDGC